MSKKKTNVGNVIMWGGTDYHYVKNNDGKDVLDSLTITTQGYGKYKGYKGETNLKTRAIFIGNAKKALNSWSKKDEAKAKAEIKRFYKILTGGGEKGFGCPISDMDYMLVNWFYRGYEKEVALIISVIDPENKHFAIPENEPVADNQAENVEPVAVAESVTEKKDDNLSWINNIPMPSKEEVAAEIERAIMEGAEKERERLRSEMTEEEKRNEIIYNILAHKYEFVKDENGKEHGVLKAESNDESNEPVADNQAESVEPVPVAESNEPVADNQAESVEPVATYSEKDITVFDCGGEFELKTAARRAIKQMLATGAASLKTGGVKYEIRYLHPAWRDYGRHYQLKAGGELESGFMLVNFDAVFPAVAFDNMGKLTGPASEIVNDDFVLQPLKPLYKPFFEPMEGAEIVEVESFEPVETIADEHQAEPVAVATVDESKPENSEPVAVADNQAESVEPVAEIISYGTPARIIGGELTTAEKRAVTRIMTEKTCTVEDAENSYHLGYNNTLEITNKASGETAVKSFTIKIETEKPVADNQAESVEPIAETAPENVEPVAAVSLDGIENKPEPAGWVSLDNSIDIDPTPVAVATVDESKPENSEPVAVAESVEPIAESKAEVDRVIKRMLTGIPTLRMKIIEAGCCLSTASGDLKQVLIKPKTGRTIELYGEKLREKLKEVEGYIGYKFTTDLIAGRRVYIEQARNTGTENTVKIWVLTRSRDMKPEALTCITKSRPWTITTSDWVTVNKQVYNLLMEDAA